MNDNKFTNEREIKYPALEDTADIRVINNNIRLLNQNKISSNQISSFLEEIAKENTSQSIKTNTDTILNKLNEKTGFNCIKSIQYGVGVNNSSSNPINVRINAVNPDKTMVLLVASYARNRNNPDYDETNVVYCNHKSATQLSFTSIIGMETYMRFAWQAIEFY